MRLLILHLATVFGGAERTTRNLILHLNRDIVRHVYVAAPAPLRAFLPDTIDAFIDTSSRLRGGWFGSTKELIVDALAAGDLIGEASPDLVLGMMHYPSALAVLGVKLKRLPVRTVGSYRGPVYEHMLRYEQGMRRNAFLRLAVGATARLADRMIVPSQGTANELRRRFLGSAGRTVVIPNGVDCDAIRSAAAEPALGIEHLAHDLPRLCVAARLSIEKDLGLLLEAFRRIQDVQPASLMIVGDGPDRAALERQIADWGLAERVAFVGHQENVYPYIASADLYVHTCQFEGFGYSMLEAMACATPVVATDCPYGPREVIGDNAYGVLVPMQNPEALATAILELLANPARREELVDLGLARAQELSVKRMVGRYESVFQDVMHRSASGDAS